MPSEQESVTIAKDIFERVEEQAYAVPVCSEKITILTSERVKGRAATDPAHLPEYWWVEERGSNERSVTRALDPSPPAATGEDALFRPGRAFPWRKS